MRKLNRNLTLATLLTLGGCAQIIGISDYDIDPKLGTAGSAMTDGGETSAGGKSDTGGKSSSPGGDGPSNGGDTTLPQGGGQTLPQGGEAPLGGGGADTGTGGAPPLGEVVPCDSAECCTQLGGTAVGVELLKDGGFELGTPDDGSPWKEVSTTTSNEVIINDLSFGFAPKAGDWFVYLSGIAGENSVIYQLPVIPKDAGWLVVSGWRLFQIDTQDDVNMDFAGVGLYEYPSGNALDIPFYWSLAPAKDGWGDTPTWKRFEASLDALPTQGKKIEIDFRGSSDDYSTDVDLSSSSYLFDELSLKSFRCFK
jgi:hypothetical protein